MAQLVPWPLFFFFFCPLYPCRRKLQALVLVFLGARVSVYALDQVGVWGEAEKVQGVSDTDLGSLGLYQCKISP